MSSREKTSLIAAAILAIAGIWLVFVGATEISRHRALDEQYDDLLVRRSQDPKFRGKLIEPAGSGVRDSTAESLYRDGLRADRRTLSGLVLLYMIVPAMCLYIYWPRLWSDFKGLYRPASVGDYR